MFKVTVVENPKQRMLVLEGRLIAAWADELRTACDLARVGLNGREFVIEIKNVTSISQAAENVLVELMSQGVKFRCCGIFTKVVLQQLARRACTAQREAHW